MSESHSFYDPSSTSGGRQDYVPPTHPTFNNQRGPDRAHAGGLTNGLGSQSSSSAPTQLSAPTQSTNEGPHRLKRHRSPGAGDRRSIRQQTEPSMSTMQDTAIGLRPHSAAAAGADQRTGCHMTINSLLLTLSALDDVRNKYQGDKEMGDVLKVLEDEIRFILPNRITDHDTHLARGYDCTQSAVDTWPFFKQYHLAGVQAASWKAHHANDEETANTLEWVSSQIETAFTPAWLDREYLKDVKEEERRIDAKRMWHDEATRLAAKRPAQRRSVRLDPSQIESDGDEESDTESEESSSGDCAMQ